MKRLLSRLWLAAFRGGLVCSSLVAACQGQIERQTATPSSDVETSLRRFLKSYVAENGFDEDKTTKYSDAYVDLGGDGKQKAIVYLSGRWWCGSGGCTTLVLAQHDSSWIVITKMTITRPPIRLLDTVSNGWRNIAVWVQGGGIQPGYEAELRYDGKSYPTNPSVPPARRLNGELPGQVVISSAQPAKPLYP